MNPSSGWGQTEGELLVLAKDQDGQVAGGPRLLREQYKRPDPQREPTGKSSSLHGTPTLHSQMMKLLLVTLVLLGPWDSEVLGQTQLSSFSGPYGTVGGISFSFSGDHLQGTITGLRVREQPGGVIRGIQLQFGGTWSKYYGAEIEVIHEFLLLPGETITQVSGKYLVYIQQLIFITSKGRQFHVGQPAGTSFNALTHRPSASLRYISGQHNGAGLTNIGFHWEINEWS
ncbi:zymogen granule membrane protein 16-like [Ornithorhynchus anatinus]|uniref:zymogen granule membrane protein 16-like n=1 Tax=Ornithorhynchus anatinus TaxID=9258 RepID=UPI0019D45BDF|nr:zymogen granule membrane protein 16-like [Ornithorhynchus anatinus]